MSKVNSFRAFAPVGSGQIHYRYWEGSEEHDSPILIAIHGSPQSSIALEAFAKKIANNGFSVIAPDTPGNGLSDPIGKILNISKETISIEHFAHTLLLFIESLKLTKPSIYGFHTGAAIACTFAAKFPEHLSNLICDGLPAWTNKERDELLSGYLPSFIPKIDGSHMCWLWSRLESQSVFFPWNNCDPDHRMNMDVRPTEHTHANAMDMLDAGHHYAESYGAAFDFKLNDWIKALRSPRLFVALKADPLSFHLTRSEFKDQPTEIFNQVSTLQDKILNQLFAITAQRSTSNIKEKFEHVNEPNELKKGWVKVDIDKLAYKGNINSSKNNSLIRNESSHSLPLVLIHRAGGSMKEFENYMIEVAKHRQIIAFDLPGHGQSENNSKETVLDSVSKIAKKIVSACKALGIDNFAVAGTHLGGQIAAWMVNNGYAKTGATFGVNCIPAEFKNDWQKNYAPTLEPIWDGNHLIRAFRIAYWEQLFFPWYQHKTKYHVELKEPLNCELIHKRAIELLKAGTYWQMAVEAEATFDLLEQLPDKRKFQVFHIANDPRSSKEICAKLNYNVKNLTTSQDWINALSKI